MSNVLFCIYSEKRDQKSVEYDFETIHNLDIWGCELAPTTREGLRSWNMSVQYWLAACVHRRLPRSYGPMRLEMIALKVFFIFLLIILNERQFSICIQSKRIVIILNALLC